MADTAPTVVTWTVNQLERNTADGAVFQVHYSVDAVSGDGVYRTGAYGSIGLEQPDPETMVPYSELTPELVLQWVKNKLGADSVDAVINALEQQISEQRQPTKATGLPWAP